MRAVNNQKAMELALKATVSAFLTMIDIHMYSGSFRHTHRHTHSCHSPRHTPSLSPLLPPLSGSAPHHQQLESAAKHFRAELRRARQAEWPCVGHPVERGNLPANIEHFSFPLSLPLVSRAAVRETVKLRLPCYPGTNDKAWLFTGRRDPGYGTHTYGRQE